MLDIDLLQNHLTADVPRQVVLAVRKDYELLVMIPQDSFEDLFSSFVESFGYNLKVIGPTFGGDCISFKQGGKPVEIVGILFSTEVIEFVTAFLSQGARGISITLASVMVFHCPKLML